MEHDDLITLDELCRHYAVELTFISRLSEYGLLEIVLLEQKPCIHKSRLGDFERLMRMHYDLDINLAGMDAISHLLDRVHHLQSELRILRSRLDSNDSGEDQWM